MEERYFFDGRKTDFLIDVLFNFLATSVSAESPIGIDDLQPEP